MCDFTEMTPYIAELRAMRARVEESLAWLDTLSPATAGPSRDAAGDFIPLDRAAAGTPSTATRSGQDDPSPADPAARGDLIEQGVSA